MKCARHSAMDMVGSSLAGSGFINQLGSVLITGLASTLATFGKGQRVSSWPGIGERTAPRGGTLPSVPHFGQVERRTKTAPVMAK